MSQTLEDTDQWSHAVEIYPEDKLAAMKEEVLQLKAWASYMDLYR